MKLRCMCVYKLTHALCLSLSCPSLQLKAAVSVLRAILSMLISLPSPSLALLFSDCLVSCDCPLWSGQMRWVYVVLVSVWEIMRTCCPPINHN